jgi:hypothetical protein
VDVDGTRRFILDNLTAAKKARPMVLVMPAGHASATGSNWEVIPVSSRRAMHIGVTTRRQVLGTLDLPARYYWRAAESPTI